MRFFSILCAAIVLIVVFVYFILVPNTPKESQNLRQNGTEKISFIQHSNPTVSLKVKDPKIALLVDKGLPLKLRITDDFATAVPAVKFQEDIPALLSALGDSENDDAVRNEILNLLRRSKFARLDQLLISALDNQNEGPRFRAFVAQHLGQSLSETSPEFRHQVTTRLHMALHDKDSEVRQEAALALVERGDKTGIETIIMWLNGAGPDLDRLRHISIRCTQELGLREHIPTIRKYVYDPNEATRIAAIVALASWKDEESRKAFEDAASSSVVRIKRSGQAALKRLPQQP